MDYLVPKNDDLQIEWAKRNLLDFITYTKPDYEVNWHHKIICDTLDRFLDPDSGLDRLIINAPPRSGKLCADSTPVLTPNGWTTHGELKVGDYVFHPSGKPIRVIALSPEDYCDVEVDFFLGTSEGEKIKCHENHEWTVYDRAGHKRCWTTYETNKFEKIKLVNGIEKPRARLQLPPRTGPCQFEEKDLPIHPYMVGVWLGDGSKNKPHITHCKDDQLYIDHIVKTCGYTVSNQWVHRDTGVYTTSFSKHGFLQNLENLGIRYEKHIPEIYLRASFEQRLQLLAGLLDSDGYIEGSRFLYSTTDKELKETLMDLLFGLGCKPYSSEEEPRLSTSGIQGRKVVYTVGAQIDFDIPNVLPRKKIKNRSYQKRKIGIKSVKRVEPELGRCIQVDSPDGLYLVGKSLIPTHNSEIVSRRFPAYALGKNPKHEIVLASYASPLAQRMNRDVQRIMDDERYLSVFPDTNLNSSNVAKNSKGGWIRTSDLFEVVGHGGSFRSTGVNGSLTGQGLTCFPEYTKVLTDKGYVKISEVVEDYKRFKVLSYNHEKELPEYKRIKAVAKQRTNKDLVKIKTFSGCEFVCTTDHPIYTKEKGYIEARLLSKGNVTLKEQVSEKSKLYNLQKETKYEIPSLQTVCFANEKSIYTFRMLLLSVIFYLKALRFREEAKEESRGFLLFKKLFTKSPRNKEHQGKKLHSLQEGISYKGKEPEYKDLLKEVSIRIEKYLYQIKKETLFSLWYTIQTYKSQVNILFKNLQGQLSQFSYDGFGQSQLQGWYRESVPTRVLHYQEKDNSERQSTMSDMLFQREPTRTPYRREQKQQPLGQPSNIVFELSYNTSQIKEDTISEITFLSEKEEYVYDIQVEDNANFFAEGTLVHNCGIIDDPIKDWKEASSKTIKDAVWEWYQSTFYTRLNPKFGKIIIMNTRWSEDDLTGRVLSLMENDPEADRWEVLDFPMIQSRHTYTHELDSRQNGELLWPDRFDMKKVTSFKKTLGSRIFNALYQQRPAPDEGGLVHRDWWKFYKQAPSFDDLDYISISWDFTFKGSKKSDYVVGQVWGRRGAKYYLLDQVRDQMNFSATVMAVKALARKWSTYREIVVEEKANGAAVIDTLKSEIRGIVPYTPRESKEARASSITPSIEAGNVYLPDPDIAPWVMDYVEEWAVFPNGANDDQIDCTSQMLIRFAKSKTFLEILSTEEELWHEEDAKETIMDTFWGNKSKGLGF